MKKNQQYSETSLTLKRREERSQLLRKKLEENQKKLKEKKTYELYVETLQILKKNKEPYLLLEPDSEEAKQADLCLRMHFPFNWGRVQWKEIPNSCCYKFANNEEAVHIIKEFCKDFPENDRVTIFFNPTYPIFIMDLKIALKYVSSLIEDDMDMWFFNKAQRWCLEVYHEGEVYMGYSTVQD